MVQITLDLPEELVSELEKRAEGSDRSVSDLVREILEPHFPRSRQTRGDISDSPEFQRAIRIQDEMRRRHEGSGFNATEFIRRMRDGG